tara:strand:+ start:121 stop:405 length:285 start_codon:yes stop_codon:yes gene_type:complete
MKEKVHFDKKDNKIVIQKTYDNQGVIDRASALRQGKHGVTGENRLVGSIPINVVAQWCKDVGVKWDDVEARKEVIRKNILSGEFDKLRVWKGTF